MPMFKYLAIPKDGAGETVCIEPSILHYGHKVFAGNYLKLKLLCTNNTKPRTINYHSPMALSP